MKKAAEFGNGKIHVIVNNAGFTWDGVIHKVCFLSLPFFLDDIYIYTYMCMCLCEAWLIGLDYG